mgnify:CR=1 FL=1
MGLLNILLNCVNNARGNLTDGKGVGAMESKLNNDYDALVSALTLAITAPTKEQAQECTGMAEFFAESLTEAEVMTAKLEATIKLGISQA